MEEKISLRELRERVGRSIARTVNALAAKKLLIIQGGMLRISEEFIWQAG